MADPIRVACSHCSTKLKLKDSSKIGKKVKCPKCGKPFVIQPVEEEPEVLDDFGGDFGAAGGYEDDYGDEDYGDDGFGDDYAEPAPARRSASRAAAAGGRSRGGKGKKTGKKKKKQSSGSNKTLLIAIGGAVGVVVLVVGILFATGVFSDSDDDGQQVAADTTPEAGGAATPGAGHGGAPGGSGGPGGPAGGHGGAPAGGPSGGHGAAGGHAGTPPAGASGPGTTQEPPGGNAAGGPQLAQAAPPVPQGKLDHSYLPPETELLVSIRPAQIWKAPILESAIAQIPPMATAMVSGQIGVSPAEIDRITIGIAGLSEATQKFQEQLQSRLQGQNGPPNGPQANPQQAAQMGFQVGQQLGQELGMAVVQKTVICVRALKPFNISPLLNFPAVKPAEHAGQPYFQVQPPGPLPVTFAFFLAGPQTVVLGTEPTIQGFLERGPNTGPQLRLDIVDDRHQFVVVGAPQGGLSSTQPTVPLPPGVPPQLQRLQELQKSALASSFGITLTDNVEVLLQVIMDEPTKAEETRTLLAQLVEQGRQGLQQAQAQIPPDVAPLLNDTMSSVQVTQAQQRVFFSVAVPGQRVQELIAKGISNAGPGGIAETPPTGAFPGTTPPATGTPPPGVTVAGPDGLSLAANVKWSDTVMLNQNNEEEPRPLVVEVTITGDQAAAAHSYGFLNVETVTGGQGQPLKQQEDRFSFNDISESYESIDRSEDEFFAEHPKNGVRVEITLEHPQQPISEIARIQGSIRIRSGGEQVVVPSILSQQGQTLSDPKLANANLQISIGESTDPKSISITCKGAADSIVSLTLLDGAGQPMDPSGYGSSGFGDTMSYDYSYDQPIPPNASLRVTLATNATVTEVPFEFQNLKVPPEPAATGF